MANAFDIANLSVLTLLSYATDLYGADLSLDELADAIEADAEETLSGEVGEQDAMLTKHMAAATANALRELAVNGYELPELVSSVTNVLDDDAIDEITGGDDDEESEDEDGDLEDEDEEDDEDSDDEDEDDLEEEDEDDESEEDEDDEDDLDEEEDDEEEEDDDY